MTFLPTPSDTGNVAPASDSDVMRSTPPPWIENVPSETLVSSEAYSPSAMARLKPPVASAPTLEVCTRSVGSSMLALSATDDSSAEQANVRGSSESNQANNGKRIDIGGVVSRWTRARSRILLALERRGRSFALSGLVLLAVACGGRATPPATALPAAPPARTRPHAVTEMPPRANAPTSPPPSPPATLRPVFRAEVADAGPLSVEQVAASGAWLVFCRQTGVPHPELVVGAGAPEAIDDLLAWDRSGRFLVLRRGNGVWLLDVEDNVSTNLSELGFDDRDDVLDYRQHRALAFDPRGEMLAYVRRRERAELVLRTLATGEEQVVAGTSGEPWRFAWDASGGTLVVSSVAPDPVSGRTTFPVRLRRGQRLACSGILPHFHVNP